MKQDKIRNEDVRQVYRRLEQARRSGGLQTTTKRKEKDKRELG